MSRTKTLLMTLALLLLCVGWSSSKHLSTDFQTSETLIPGYVVLAASSVTAGTDGVVAVATVNAASAPTQTSSITSFPYPARLDIRLYDGGSATATALTCTSVALVGYNAAGQMVSETVSSITESESLTSNSYESLSSFTASGCNSYTGSADASDVLRIGLSDHVALDHPIRATSDLISVCGKDLATGTWTCTNAACTVRECSRTVDIGACTLNPSDYDVLKIRYRSTSRRTLEICP